MRVALLMMLFAAPMARAEEDAPSDGGIVIDVKQENYRGVTPGGSNLPPHPPKLPVRTGPQKMTWPGFQLRDGVPTVFLELTGTPNYRVVESPGHLTIVLPNTEVPVRNNRRPLNVAYFNTSVKTVATASRGKAVHVTISTSEKSAPTHRERVEEAAGGFHMLIIELPAK